MSRNYDALQIVTAGEWNEVKDHVANKRVALRMAQTKGDIVRVEPVSFSGWDDWVRIIFHDGWTHVKKTHNLLCVPLKQGGKS